ncbi:hypothetical protein Tco_1196539 [Tanacetum coccineum]
MAESNEYISFTQTNFLSNDNEGIMIKKSVVEIQGAFLEKIRDNTFNGVIGENAFRHINEFLKVVEPIKVKGLTNDRFRLSIFLVSLKGAVSEWFTKECIGSITTWENLVERKAKWPTCNSDIDGFCNEGELLGMVRVGGMTYFQDHKWYDELADGKLKDEALMCKARIEESWGDATSSIIKFCTWLKDIFKNFHELDHDTLAKLEECWWKINAHEIFPFTRWENFG